MNKLWLYIKKFFAILASIIYGAFKDRVDYKEDSKQVSPEELERVTKTKDKAIRNFNDDDPGEKSRAVFDKQQDKEEIIYNAKRDIQKLVFIQKNIIKIEEEISKCEDIEELYSLKEEWKKAKYHFDKIAKQYERIDIDNKVIKDIKNTIKDTNKMIVSQEKTIDNKIFKLKQEQKIEEEHVIEEVVEKKIVGKKEEKKEVKDKKEQDKEETSKETIVEEEKEEYSKETIVEENQLEEVEKEIEIKEIEEIIPNEDLTIKKDENSKVREMPIAYSSFKKNKDDLNQNKSNRNLVAVAMILAQARAIASSTNITALLQLNPTIAVSSTLHVNNEVRRTRKQVGARVKDLNLEKVVNTVGLNPELQARYIVANSLKEIRKLRGELRQFGNTPEVVNALNELDELEMELLLQINELQMQNQNQHDRHR